MIRELRRAGFALLVGGTLLAAGCGDELPADWTPVLETTSTSYLHDEIVRALVELEEARSSLPADPDAVTEHLDATEVHLQRLRDVYLPLLDARERAYNAYRLHYLGRDTDAISQVVKIRTMILAVSHQKNESFLTELERIQELVADARLRLEAGSPSATDALRALALELDDVMNRAGIFFEGGR